MKKIITILICTLAVSIGCKVSATTPYSVMICADITKDETSRIDNLYIEPALPNSPDEYTRISDTCIGINYKSATDGNQIVPYYLPIKVSNYNMNSTKLLDTYILVLGNEGVGFDGLPYKKILHYNIIDATFENDIKDIGSVTSVTEVTNGIANETNYIGFSLIPPVLMNEYITNLYKIGATKYDNNISFKPEGFITREQAAKFFVKTRSKYSYPNNELGGGDKKECHFSSENIDPSLATDVYTACDLGIMKGSKGKFYPKETLTLGQAVTILTRITDGNVYEPAGSLWFETYFTLAYRNGLFAGGSRTPYLLEGNQRVSRGEMAIMINNVLNSK